MDNEAAFEKFKECAVEVLQVDPGMSLVFPTFEEIS